MQENWLQLEQAFDPASEFVLATIVETRGATYRKVGTMMLIDHSGVCTGLLSGGCLEADISLHAVSVFRDKRSKILKYDLQADAQLLWGLGLGCDGEIDILLQPLLPENDHLGFTSLLAAVKLRKTGYYCQNIFDDAEASAWFVEHELVDDFEPRLETDHRPSEMCSTLIIPVFAPISLLICGAGPDSVPVVNMASQLGWQVTIWDHRPAYLAQSSFGACYEKRKIRASYCQVSDFDKYDAVVVMTHHLENDSEYLAKLIPSTVSYIGLLGPVGRRDKLLNANEIKLEDIQGRVYGPVGLNLGGRSPQAIALSITAQIQQHMSAQYQAKCYQPWYSEFDK